MSESLDFIFERANSALITQDFEYAERLLTNALKKHHNISSNDKKRIENLLARIYGDEGDLERSLAAYSQLYERDPDNIELMLRLGRIYRHLARYEDALQILKKAQALGGDTDEVLYSLAKTYKRMRDYDKAADYFTRAIEIKPDHAHAYDRLGNLYVLTGETRKAIEVYKQGLRADPNHPYLNFHLAELLRQEKRYQEAIGYYNSALRVNSAWAEVFAGIAAAYLQLDKLDNALNAYRSLLRISGENASLYTALGNLFEKKQLPQEAEQYYYDALAIDSGYAPAALALTQLLERKRQHAEALPILLAAEAAPANADNHELRLKAIQMCMYAKDYAKAQELLGRLDAEHRESLNGLKLEGELYALMGEAEQAEAIFEHILARMPSAIEFRKELAEQYLLAHKYEEAKEQLQLFLKQKPTDISALMTLGRTEELLNNPQAAYQEYQKALDLKPDAIEARSALARLFQQQGDTIAALKTANEILNMQSGSESNEAEHDLAASLALYEQMAENYSADPLLTKNLEQLKRDDSSLYISPAELNPEPRPKVPSLQDVVQSERELPFEMFIEGTEEIQELPPEEDERAISAVQLGGALPPRISDQPIVPHYSNDVPALYGGTVEHSDNVKPFADEQFADIAANTITENTTPAVSQSSPDVLPEQFTTEDTEDNDELFAPIDELYLNPEDTETNPVFGIREAPQEKEKALYKRQNLLRDEAIQERLKVWDTYGTTMGFLQDVISDIDKKLDSNQFAQAIEVLAERIAKNLSQKIPMPPVPQQEAPLPLQEELQPEAVPQSLEAGAPSALSNEEVAPPSQEYAEAPAFSNEATVPVNEDIPVDEAASMSDDIPVDDGTSIDGLVTETIPMAEHITSDENSSVAGAISMDESSAVAESVSIDKDSVEVVETQEDALFNTEEGITALLKADDLPIMQEIGIDNTEADAEEASKEEAIAVQNNSDQDDIEISVDDELLLDDSAVENKQKQGEPHDPFMLDQDQQNLLWCHAKHQIKASPSFEQYLNTADPGKLAQLFSYLRDLFTYLPQGELETFLNSSERMQIYYIIARLSGDLGLKERGELIRQAYSVVAAQPPYNNEAVFQLLMYLRDLSMALPDQELGLRVRQDLEQLMANMSTVMPAFA